MFFIFRIIFERTSYGTTVYKYPKCLSLIKQVVHAKRYFSNVTLKVTGTLNTSCPDKHSHSLSLSLSLSIYQLLCHLSFDLSHPRTSRSKACQWNPRMGPAFISASHINQVRKQKRPNFSCHIHGF